MTRKSGPMFDPCVSLWLLITSIAVNFSNTSAGYRASLPCAGTSFISSVGCLPRKLRSPSSNQNRASRGLVSLDEKVAIDDGNIEKALQIISCNTKEDISDLSNKIQGKLQSNNGLVLSILSAPTDHLPLVLGCRNNQKNEKATDLLLRHPYIAERVLDPKAFIRPTDEWLCNYLSLSSSEEKSMHSRWSNSRSKQIQSLGRHRIHEWLSFLLSDSVGLGHDQLRKIIVSRPQLLSYKLSNLQVTINFFREELGFSSKELASLLQSYPSVLMYSIDNRLRPTVEFLQNVIGGGKENWASWKHVVISYPKMFAHSIERTLLPKVDFFCNVEKEKALVLSRSELSKVVATFPPILWLSEGNLKAKLDFLSVSLNLNDAELRTLIVSYPHVLGLSLENNLKHKMDFFLHPKNVRDSCPSLEDSASMPTLHAAIQKEGGDSINCGFSKNQLKEFVLYQPALLAYSLENRLKPRIRRMQECNISFFYSPKGIMSYTNDKFDTWISLQVASWSVSE